MRKSFMFMILATIAVVVLLILVVPSTPKATEEILETEIVALTEQDTEEISISEADIDESVQDTNESSETDAEKSSEQPKYMGRQIENYAEPQTENLHIRIHEFQLEYRDTYQSNIVIVPQDIHLTNIDGYEWFDYDPKPTNAYYRLAQFVCYAIFTYYDGNVPCDYYVYLVDDGHVDIHNSHFASTMIFEVQTHGKKPLNICLDTYNYKIRVDEGVAKKNPICKRGCCAD